MTRGAAGLLLCLTLSSAAPLRSQEPSGLKNTWGEVASWFHRRVAEEGIVGGTLWLVHGGRVLAREHQGFADRATRRRIDDNTIYHWASITKTFTGIAVMQLRDRGRLRLEDSVVHYLPALRMVYDSFGPVDAITLREIMSHSSGFRDPTWPWKDEDKAWQPHEPTRWEQLVAMMPYTEILFRPGSRFGYSNLAIIFLGQIIQQLSGDDYEVYMDKNVLKPLGMYRSYFDLTPYHLLRDRSNNYSIRNRDTVANGLDFDTGITTSNGGLNAPVPDMVRYLSFLMGSADTTAAAVLKRSSLEEMWRPVVHIPPDTTTPPLPGGAWDVSMGLSFFIYKRDGVTIVSHSGGQKSFSTIFYLDPATQVAAIAAFNTRGDPRPDLDAVFRELKDRMLNRVFPLFRRPR